MAPYPRKRRQAAARTGRPAALLLESLEERCLLDAAAAYGQLPLAFEPNVGQAASRADFIVRGSGYTLLLSADQAILGLAASGNAVSQPSGKPSPPATNVLGMRLVNAAASSQATGLDKLPGVSNYLIGNDPSQWHTNIPTYGEVAYRNVYPGVDLLYHGTQGQLEYDFSLQPGAHPGVIRLAIDGAQSMTLDAGGDLVVRTAGGIVTEHAPNLYQDVGGVRRAIAGRYVLENNHTVGFAVGAYDASVPLVIDPVLIYSTYLGGSDQDLARAIAVDASGSAYLTGFTASTNFPTANPLQATNAGNADVFITKLNPAGSALVYSTYLGGNAIDDAAGIAVDAAGDAYVTGFTESTNFPTLNPFQATNPGGVLRAFIAKLKPAGNGLLYSTYLGGSKDTTAEAIAIDAAGNAYVAGDTFDSDFPTAHAFQPTYGGNEDAFVTKLNATGNALIYSTYLGGNNVETAAGIAVDSSGNAYVVGNTQSSNFPTAAALQRTYGGGGDAFVTKFNAAGSALVYSTYLGGTNQEGGTAIALDATGSAYVTGFTDSADFPLVNPLQSIQRGPENAFVSKIDPAGNALEYSTYLGGTSLDVGTAIAVDSADSAYVVGFTQSSDFPTVNPLQAANAGHNDVFVSKLSPAGSALVYSTYLGGVSDDIGDAVAVDSSGNAYLTGYTGSTSFPTLHPLQPAYGGGSDDGFVTKIASHFWTAQDVTVGSDGNTRLLWDALNGQSVQWSVTNSFQVSSGPVFGPFSGWTAQADAAGSDGLSRILWTNTNGTAALWLVRNDGTITDHLFGPFSGWSAEDVTVSSDGNSRILWTNVNGQAVIWSVDANFNVTSGAVFGPFAGWTATKLAAGGDGFLRLLWNNTNGAAALWILSGGGGIETGVFGPISPWTARDVTVGSDNRTRILWGTANGGMVLWSLDNNLTVSSSTVFGAFVGDQAVRLESGSDGFTRVLWDSVGGTEVIWLLSASGSFLSAGSFGPL